MHTQCVACRLLCVRLALRHVRMRPRRWALLQVEGVTSWPACYASQDWHTLVDVLNRTTLHGYATAGSEAVAVALWALCTSWGRPEQAVIVAASFGGNAPATAQMVGAMAGALHADAWLPQRWVGALENEQGTGRDAVLATAAALEGLRCAEP
jgi:hypothetical protein